MAKPKAKAGFAGAHGSAALTYEQYQDCLKEADERMKANNGHQYLHILKTRCMNCGRSPKVKTRCGGWFNTFVNILGCILQEKGVIVEKTPSSLKRVGRRPAYPGKSCPLSPLT
jgi:hypothetical protein